MRDSLFKAIPKLNEAKVPFQLKESLLLEWLLELSKTESRQACSEILQVLQELNQNEELAAKPRFSFLKLIFEYAKLHIQNLMGSCWDNSWPISDKDQDYAEAVVWNYLALSEGFFIAAQYLKNRTDEVFALHSACYCLGQAQLHIAAVYSNPNPFFWQLLYQIFAWVEKYGLFGSKTNEGQFEHISLNDVFAQLLIFQLCDTHQFRPRDMQTIFNFLPTVCSNFSVYKLSDIKFQTEVLKIPYLQAVANNFGNLANKLADSLNLREDIIVFDIKHNVPPVIFNPTCLLTTSSLRYFTATSVVEHLDKVLQQGEAWNGVLKSINHELFSRVIRTLAPGRKRKHERSTNERIMLGVVGFENIVSFLYKVEQKNFSQDNLEEINQHTDQEDLIAKEDSDRIHRQMGAIDGGFTEIDFTSGFEQDNGIWNYKNNLDMIERPVVLKRLTIFDYSASGYLLHWVDDESSKTRVGDIFAVISEDKKRLDIALVRRIVITQQDYKFGVEILGAASEAVIVSHADNSSSGGWGIFIPVIQTEGLTKLPSIVYPIGRFHPGDAICIYKNNKKVKAVIAKELNATSTIVHAELA